MAKRKARAAKRYTYEQYLDEFSNGKELREAEIYRNGTPAQVAELIVGPIMERFSRAVRRLLKQARKSQ